MQFGDATGHGLEDDAASTSSVVSLHPLVPFVDEHLSAHCSISRGCLLDALEELRLAGPSCREVVTVLKLVGKSTVAVVVDKY